MGNYAFGVTNASLVPKYFFPISAPYVGKAVRSVLSGINGKFYVDNAPRIHRECMANGVPS